MDSVQQQRVAVIGTAIATPFLIGAVLLTIHYGETLVSWAKDWPGGPVWFMVALALVSILSMLVLATTCLMYAWPDRTPQRLRISAAARVAWATVAGLLTIATSMPLAMTLRRPGSRPLDCEAAELDCFLRAEAPGAIAAWIVVFLAVGVLGSVTLHRVFTQPSRNGRPDAGS